MKKYKCTNMECNYSCELRTDVFPHKCVNWYYIPTWVEMDGTEPVMESNQLPKLTAEVFDLPDCPEWAKWAAVDKYENAMWYDEEPKVFRSVFWNSQRGQIQGIPGKWDASDWRNSLIERPAKALPDWCKVDATCWHKRCGYFKVTYIDDVFKRVDIQQVEDKSKGYFSFNTMCNEVRQARLRPYNADEMRALVGKVIATKEDIALVVGYRGCQNKVIVGMHENHGYFSAEKLLDYNATIDGKPCGKFEHLENGEWVE